MSDIPMGDSDPGESYRKFSDPGKKRVSMACLACKKSKRKCSGTAPCDNCRTFNRQCVFDETLDQRRRVAAKRTADELSYHRDMLNDMLKVMKAENQSYAFRLLEIVRNDASTEEIRAFIDETLAHFVDADKESPLTVQKMKEIRRVIDLEGAGPSFRPQVMDIHYLCGEVPIRVPAKPWTTVTEDPDLVSHLVSLYFTWDYPLHAFLDRDVFLTHMISGNTGSQFCSPFLVNALLANACYFSDYTEAYVDPGDIVTKGADFLAAAERLRDEEPVKLSLAYLQGTLLLFERYSLSGDNDLGYKMLHLAIWTGESLGLIGPKIFRMEPGHIPEDMDISVRRTAWGLFHIDTVIHASFLRPSLIDKVNVERPNTEEDSAMWYPYPSRRSARPAYLGQYFDESCDLCEIARDISRRLFAVSGTSSSAEHQRRIKEIMYERLCRWHDALPAVFDPECRPPPYIILLRMRYYTLIITMFTFTPKEDLSRLESEAPQTPESPPGLNPFPKYNADEIVLSAARNISALALPHRWEYGMTRAHQFALYAINLALFIMLRHGTFDVLDPDFLMLASSFHSIASRSRVGRNLFHIFLQNTRSRGQGQRLHESTGVTEALKALFDAAGSSHFNPLEDYTKGLEKLDTDERYRGTPGEELDSISSMLDRYESLSLGKDEIAPERPHQGDS
ncbi:putative C6 transcription factor [Aspergillus steynii IBT 23096]|uniref:Putative C6 transcription factor n=1 Tax=Aspergillus steynii IBT 23096 TaxID=1392250 RepID=A0A2I2G9T4_9EURO|nr:putative C6 transcription factor [Aspergillus steynii IBT 23096]PLB49634.1 putative C6 transcription factor [Aspergillus steynii IBT 23096]